MANHFADNYRPKNLEEVIGNEETKSILASQLENNSLRHSWLFVGGFGLGKTTLARILAASVGAQAIEWDCGADGGIEAIRELVESSRLTSFFGKGKAFILDEVHKLSAAAQTVLLKAVEEPAPGVYWILCTSESAKIIPALVSRCIPITLLAAGRKEISIAARRVLKDFPLTLEDKEDWNFLVEKSEGSLRKAYNLLEKLVFGAEEGFLSSARFRSLLGEVEKEQETSLPNAFLKGSLRSYLQAVSDLRKSGKEPSSVLIGLYEYLKKIPGKEKELLEVSFFLATSLESLSWYTVEYIGIKHFSS